jgi:glycosyltransferase involved in cell wall biosynthesis
MAMVAARLLGIGFSFTLHGSDLLLRGDLLAEKLRECQFCITVSNFNRNYILDHYPRTPPSKVIVQRLGVDRVPTVIKVLPMTKRKTRHCLLAVGRLHSVKNYTFLIEACAVLQSGGLDFLCWIAGEGSERSNLERLIRRLRLESHVRLLGHVPRAELSGYYQHADLVVMTSTSEGLPVALMEAMAHGRLVLAPAITGIPELVENRRSGFLYRAGSLEDFVNTAEWILERKEWLGDVGRAAAKTISRDYDRQKNVRRFADQFLDRITLSETVYESPVLQQV